MRIAAIIPARYHSTRLPAKPLQKLGGKSIIEWVYSAVKAVIKDVVVATDDVRIAEEVERFGGCAIMTSEAHRSGTDRCAEALTKMGGDYDVVINVQGDEPFIRREHIEALIACFNNPETEIATLAKPMTSAEDMADIHNPNSVKVVTDLRGRALYFSRAAIPFQRDVEQSEWSKHHTYLKHIGVYAFRAQTLRTVTSLEVSSLEQTEKLEQLRWLEHGYYISVAKTPYATVGIDTPEDLQRAEEMLNKA
jgi:3-deoxy-manno-octulosonate cytidylyltransferase (CMP-KDO synthetase)